jgi:hypothetical protein
MSQTTFKDFTAPQSKLPAVNSCWNCHNKQDVTMRDGVQTVRCFGSFKAFRQNCHLWSDGKELEHMDRCRPPAGFLPKKWTGGRA